MALWSFFLKVLKKKKGGGGGGGGEAKFYISPQIMKNGGLNYSTFSPKIMKNGGLKSENFPYFRKRGGLNSTIFQKLGAKFYSRLKKT